MESNRQYGGASGKGLYIAKYDRDNGSFGIANKGVSRYKFVTHVTSHAKVPKK